MFKGRDRRNFSMGAGTGRFALLCAAAGLGAASHGLSGCGNGWVDSADREESPSSLIQDANHAYDRGDYDKAVALFSKIVGKDPYNQDARVGLAYAYQGSAGLSLVQVVKDFSAVPSSSSSGGSSSGTSDLVKFTEILGLNSAEKAQLQNATKTVAGLRAQYPKLAKLHNAWLAACPLVPQSTLDAAIGTDPTVKALFGCASGLPAGATPRSSALLAAAVAQMAEAAALYQAVFDADGNGKVDFEERAAAIKADIETASAQSASASTASASLTKMNQALGALKTLSGELQGETVLMAMAEFRMVASLVGAIPGLDSKVKTQIENSVKNFTAAQEKINGISGATSGGATPTATAEERAKMEAQATKASQGIDSAYQSEKSRIDNDGALTPTQKAEQEAQLEAKRDEACANFDAFKAQYNLPNAQRPAECN